MRRPFCLAACAATALLLVTACGGSARTVALPSRAPSGTPASAAFAREPSVEITYPVEGQTMPAGDVLVALTVRSFDIVDVGGRAPRDGEGHLVYYLDVDPIPTGPSGALAVSGRGRAAPSQATSHTWKKVAAGTHVLGVQLVGNDGRPLDPPTTDHLQIVVGSH